MRPPDRPRALNRLGVGQRSTTRQSRAARRRPRARTLLRRHYGNSSLILPRFRKSIKSAHSARLVTTTKVLDEGQPFTRCRPRGFTHKYEQREPREGSEAMRTNEAKSNGATERRGYATN